MNAPEMHANGVKLRTVWKDIRYWKPDAVPVGKQRHVTPPADMLRYGDPGDVRTGLLIALDMANRNTRLHRDTPHETEMLRSRAHTRAALFAEIEEDCYQPERRDMQRTSLYWRPAGDKAVFSPF